MLERIRVVSKVLTPSVTDDIPAWCCLLGEGAWTWLAGVAEDLLEQIRKEGWKQQNSQSSLPSHVALSSRTHLSGLSFPTTVLPFRLMVNSNMMREHRIGGAFWPRLSWLGQQNCILESKQHLETKKPANIGSFQVLTGPILVPPVSPSSNNSVIKQQQTEQKAIQKHWKEILLR